MALGFEFGPSIDVVLWSNVWTGKQAILFLFWSGFKFTAFCYQILLASSNSCFPDRLF
jgi:hypothetical protein